MAAALAAGAAASTAMTAVAIAISAGPPQAARAELHDARDGKRPLDIREVDSGAPGRRVVFTIITWSRWQAGHISGRGYLLVYLDTLSEPGPDYYVLLRSSGRHMRGILFRVSKGRRDRRLARVRAWRPDRRSVSFRLPRKKVKLSGGLYSWYAQTLFTSDRCKHVCFDRAPDTGGVQEMLPAASPSAGPRLGPAVAGNPPQD